MARSTYKTKQKELVLNYLKENKDKHVTVEEIKGYLSKQDEKAGQTTIYRCINVLVDEGTVRKYIIGKGKPACFQYVENGQVNETLYHLKCNVCGEVLHVDCDMLEDVEIYLKQKFCFRMDSSKVLICGTCEKCM